MKGGDVKKKKRKQCLGTVLLSLSSLSSAEGSHAWLHTHMRAHTHLPQLAMFDLADTDTVCEGETQTSGAAPN